VFGINLFSLFRHDDAGGDASRGMNDFVGAALERVVRMTNPRLRLLDRWRERLAPATEIASAYAHGLAHGLPSAIDADPAQWAGSDALRAFFVGRDEIAGVYGASQELRRLLRREPLIDEAWAMLAMQVSEQKRLGMALEGDAVRHDVVQSTLSFSQHRVRVCAGSEAGLREAVAWQVIDQLALRALSRLTRLEDLRHELEIDRALLEARLRMLQREGAGLDGRQPDAAALARLEARLDANAHELDAAGGGTQALERALEVLRDTLATPAVLVRCAPRREILSTMNVRLTQPVDGPHLAVEFVEAYLDGEPPVTLAVMPTRFPRHAMPALQHGMAQRGRALL